MASVSKYTDQFIDALLAVDRVVAREILGAAFKEACLDEVVSTLIAPALERIGDDWAAGRVSLSEIYMSSKISEELMRPLVPLAAPVHKDQPRIGIAALLDYHLLGKKMVQLVLLSAGYEVTDYGQGISVDELVKCVQRDSVDVLLISTLMLPSALKVKNVRDKCNELGLSPKIVVGGAPFRFDDRLWKEVGADAMGFNATDALRIVDFLTQEHLHAA